MASATDIDIKEQCMSGRRSSPSRSYIARIAAAFRSLRIIRGADVRSIHPKRGCGVRDESRWQTSRFGVRVFTACICWWMATAGLAQNSQPVAQGWRTALPEQVRIDKGEAASWKVTSRTPNEFTIESQESLVCKPGDAFAVNLNI